MGNSFTNAGVDRVLSSGWPSEVIAFIGLKHPETGEVLITGCEETIGIGDRYTATIEYPGIEIT